MIIKNMILIIPVGDFIFVQNTAHCTKNWYQRPLDVCESCAYIKTIILSLDHMQSSTRLSQLLLFICVKKINFYYSSRLLIYANWRKTTALLSEPQLITSRKLYSCILTWHIYMYFSLITFIFKARRIDNKWH